MVDPDCMDAALADLLDDFVMADGGADHEVSLTGKCSWAQCYAGKGLMAIKISRLEEREMRNVPSAGIHFSQNFQTIL